ncbi:MAG: autotransporter-associated beta strand repeat-containing protein, partial [Chloroflexota bacterium]|nr:autotransporter-associated beta strand repeat-containing protein [Chloroflexota bacterium]
SWIGNKVPGSANIALWDRAGAAMSLGSNLSWLGLQVTTATSPLTINAGNSLTIGTAGIDMSNAAVDFNINCSLVLGADQTWSVASGRALAVAGVISGTGGLTKSGSGIITLSGVNTYTGNTTINGGTLSISDSSALGSNIGALTINPTGIVQATNTFSASRDLVLGGTGGSASGGTIDVTGANNYTRNGVISGTGSLTKTGSGTLTLSAANTFTGDFFLNGGTVSVTGNQALGASPAAGSGLYAVHLGNGTTLQLAVGSTGANRRIELVSGTATVDVTTGISQQRDGLVYGAGGLIKTGTGVLTLTNANTYSGGTTINAGTFQVNNTGGSGTGTGAVTVNSGGTLSGLPTANGFANVGSISGAVSVNSGGTILARSGNTFTFGGLTLNAGAVTTFQIGATTNLPIISITGINGLNLAGSSTVNVLNAGGLAAGIYRLFDYSGSVLASIANLSLGSTPGAGFVYALSNNQTNSSIDLLVSLSNAQWLNDADGNWGTTSNWGDGVVPNSVGAQANFLGVINQARTVTVNGAFTVGSITFDNANSYTLASSGVAGQGLTLNNNGIALIAVHLGQHTISAPVTLANNLTITASANTGLTLSGALSGAKTVTLDGAGGVTFSGTSANTYTGLTTVSAGTLSLGKTAGVNAIGTGGIQIDAGATASLLASEQIADTASLLVSGTFAMGTFLETLAALNGAGSVTIGTGSTLTVGASNNLNSTFTGVISGTGTIAKAGSGTLTLSGANTFGGAGQTVALNAGTLLISADNNLGNSANSVTLNGATLGLSAALTSARNFVLNAGGGTIDTGNNAATFSGTLSGAGAFTKAGSGTLTLAGTNTYSGGSTINAGTVIVSSASNLGTISGALALNAGTLEVATGFSTARNITLGNAASTIRVDPSQTYTVSGIVSGSGALNKTGAGTLTLTTANTFTGATIIDGTLIAAATTGGALAQTSSITVNNGGTLLLGASNQIKTTASLTLDGGTFAKGNFSQGTANSVGLGALTLAFTGSHIDFGTGTVGVLSFASFDPSVDLLAITIDNWTGTANTLGNASTDRLIFNTSLSNSYLSLFEFTGYAAGATQVNLGGGFYEVVPVAPVPEPATYAAGALSLLALTAHQRRRLAHALRLRRAS